MERLDRALTAAAALLLVALGCLPLANWIPGGLSAPWYSAVAGDLLNGSAIALGLGVVVAILTRHRQLPRLPGLKEWMASAGPEWLAALGLLAFALYALVARAIFSGRPLLIDEIVQVFQARILTAGHLTLPAAAHQEFFSSFHVVEQGGRVYGQFPIGGPAMLALGTLVGAEWLVGPVFGALSVLGFGALVRRIEPRRGVALGATLLFALAPFAVFMAGSHMNHVTTLCWLVLGCWGLSRAVTDEARWRDGLLTGLGFGLAATIRPADALAFAVPAGIWLLVRAIRRRRVAVLLASGLGIALPVLLLAWVNWKTTGAPLRFGYTVLWGRAHDLGFHATPWGPVHTPVRGLELLNLYLLRLQSYLYEAAGPALLPATAALALTRRLRPFDRYLLAASALLLAAYFAYWHDGFYLGPRFLYPLLPVLALWTARLPAAIRERTGHGAVLRATTVALAAAVLLGMATALPTRVRQYRGGLLSLRWDPNRAAAAAGVRGALVLVRESWGAELIARMWALDVSRPDAEALYRAADPCRLELALSELEQRSARGAVAVAALAPLRADSARLVKAEEITGDPSLRLTRGMRYPASCLRKLEENRAGFTLFAPLLLARGGGNVYARDLGARDSLVLRDFPERPVYLLRPASGRVGAEPQFSRLERDSLLAAWRAGR
ncbi:MAG TPA: hypothetical protein VGQ69_11495 [Gemmatimonadales bacterium]|jgi:hypothetical protein|nr:hypothetical protein [Gemmatimonadales bacterium]